MLNEEGGAHLRRVVKGEISMSRIAAILLACALAACESRQIPIAETSEPGRTAAMSLPSDSASPGLTATAAPMALAIAEKQEGEIRAHHLNVGAGSCAIVECPGPDTSPVIVDCGSLEPTETDLSRDEVTEYIQSVLARYSAAPIVTISHPDADHYKYIPTALAGITPRSVWLGGSRDEFPGAIDTWLTEQEAAGVEIQHGFAPGFSNGGEPVAELPCGTAQTFIMTVNVGASKNANTMVLGVKHGDFGMIFSGDAEGETEASAAANFPGEFAESVVLTGSHHGASTHDSNSPEWADVARPDVTVFSSGDRFFHPRCSSAEVYRDSLTATNPHPIRCGSSTAYTNSESEKAEYVTQTNGTIIITGGADGSFSIDCSLSEACGRPAVIGSLAPRLSE